MDASVVWPQKGFLFTPLENSCIMSVTANGLSCFAFSETNDELVAPFFHIRYAPFYFFLKKGTRPVFLSMNVDVSRNLII